MAALEHDLAVLGRKNDPIGRKPKHPKTLCEVFMEEERKNAHRD